MSATPPEGPDPATSRPGTLDDGFNIVAKDLDRAFALGLSPNQAVIMNHVREQSWTAAAVTRRRGEPRPDAVPAQVNLSRLAAATGLNRSRLSVDLKGLVAGLVLDRSAAGFLIRKDYARWLDDDGMAPRFSPAQVDYIRAAKRRKRGAGAVAMRNSAVLQSATPEDGVVLQSATATVAKRNSDCCKAQQRPIEERAPGDFLDLLDSLHTGAAPDSDLAHSQEQRGLESTGFIRQAETVLAADLRTHALAMELGRQHNLPGVVEIDGWRFLIASRRILEPGINDSARRSLKYLVAIAANLPESSRAEIDGPRKNGQSGRAASARAERNRRQDEGFARALEEIGDI